MSNKLLGGIHATAPGTTHTLRARPHQGPACVSLSQGSEIHVQLKLLRLERQRWRQVGAAQAAGESSPGPGKASRAPVCSAVLKSR